MKPLYLYIENFTSHEKSEIDFTGFSAALIIGKTDNSDLISNGTGKTSIFRAIEYVLFNQSRDPIQEKDILLENLIREGSKKCKIIFDFMIGDEIFRVIRARTDKGVADLSFFKRSALQDVRNAHTIDTDKDLWVDISSRRIQDTEADLYKQIKTNYKGFINTSHFMQFDFRSGLAAATPAHRKTILKEVLDLVVYSKLEKIAKTNADTILKEVEKNRTIISAIGNPIEKIEEYKKQILDLENEHIEHTKNIADNTSKLNKANKEREDFILKLSVLETQISSSLEKRKSLEADIVKINDVLIEYSGKRKSILSDAKSLTTLLEKLKLDHTKCIIEEQDITKHKLLIEEVTNKLTTIKSQRSSLNEKLDELNIPLPEDGTCKHCRQILTAEHRNACQENINNDIEMVKNKLNMLVFDEKELIQQQRAAQITLKELENNLIIYNSITNKIAYTIKDFEDKKRLYEEYNSLIEKFNADLNNKTNDLERAKLEVEKSSEKEINDLKIKIVKNRNEIDSITLIIKNTNLHINSINQAKAILLHSIEERNNDLIKKENIEKEISSLEITYSIYPSVIQAFSSTGIPSLIISNILEDLQMEANNLLSQLRPGLQLAFEVEKIKGDGEKDDTLEIKYFLNNKERDYSQLSGAQKICIMFSLKLGLSFLLKKLLGTQINLLLLDEIDQPLDKAGVDALEKIIKHFQQDFTILIITHNDRLKYKFNTAIVVEQNQDMISRAKVASSW